MSQQRTRHQQVSISRLQPGEIIFREGQASTSIYVIKSGAVDITILRGTESILLDQLKAGDCFGEMATILGGKRQATAKTNTYTELYQLSESQLQGLLKSAHPVVRQLIVSQVNRLNAANTQRGSNNATNIHPLISAAELLQLHAAAQPPVENKTSIKLDYKTIMQSLCRIQGISSYSANQVLLKMDEIGLIEISGKASATSVIFETQNLVARTEKLSQCISYDACGQSKSEAEFMDLNSLAEFTRVEKRNLMNKLLNEAQFEDVLVFRRTAVTSLLQEKGSDYFSKPMRKPMEDWNSIRDLEYVNTPTLEKVLGSLDPYQLSTLIHGADNESKARLLSCLSSRKKEMLESMADDLENHSEIDTKIVVAELFDKIRAAKTGQLS